MREQIIALLREKRIKEALTQLVAYSTKVSDWSINQQIEELQTSYELMLQYTRQGMKDPNKETIYHRFLRSAYKLADRIYTLDCLRRRESHYYAQMYAQTHRPPLSFAQLQLKLEAYTENIQTAPLLYPEPKRQAQEMAAIRRTHYEAVDELFNKVWTSQAWTEIEAQEADELFDSPLVQAADLAVLISAVTLNQLHVFDIRKFCFLLTAYQHPNNQVNQRALVGVALCCYYHDERIHLYPEAMVRLGVLQEDTTFVNDLYQVQIQLLQSARETQKVDKKMREEILPEIIRNQRRKRPRLGIDATETSDDHNPEWEEWTDQSDVRNKVREVAEMQMEGADVYMSTFSQLKHYPFFQQVPHWFYLFDPQHPDIDRTSTSKEEKGRSLFDMLTFTDLFCNSDRYSLILTMIQLPELQPQNLPGEMKEQLNATLDAYKQEHDGMQEDAHKEVIRRQYIQDVYRFFKLWMKRHEMHDIFQDDLELWKRPTLSSAVLHRECINHLADFLLSHDYLEEAGELFQLSLERYHADDASLWQKMGYIHQETGDYAQAIRYYLQADLLKPDNVWNNRHIAQCYKKGGNYEEAVTYYKKVEQVQPDNLNLALQIGQCLLELNRYEEAATYFFKIAYIDPGSKNAVRGIAWCLFIMGKHEEAKKYYSLLVDEPQPSVEDWMNAGHVYYLLGEAAQAIDCYRQAQRLCESHSAFLKCYQADKEALLKQGMSETDFYLLPDELV